jgi:hypothetical protein
LFLFIFSLYHFLKLPDLPAFKNNEVGAKIISFPEKPGVLLINEGLNAGGDRSYNTWMQVKYLSLNNPVPNCLGIIPEKVFNR